MLSSGLPPWLRVLRGEVPLAAPRFGAAVRAQTAASALVVATVERLGLTLAVECVLPARFHHGPPWSLSLLSTDVVAVLEVVSQCSSSGSFQREQVAQLEEQCCRFVVVLADGLVVVRLALGIGGLDELHPQLVERID